MSTVISTRFIPATHTEGGRIRASSGGKTITVPFSYSTDSPHLEAAAALLTLLEPAADPRKLQRGATPTARGYRFTVPVPEDA